MQDIWIWIIAVLMEDYRGGRRSCFIGLMDLSPRLDVEFGACT